MANLLPFTIYAMRLLKERYPDRVLVLGGVGSKAVEGKILERFPWVDIIARGEGELTGPELVRTLRAGGDLTTVAGISYRTPRGEVRHNPDRPRIRDLDSVPFPAFHKVDLKRYAGYGMMTSRGCPYPCTFCSVAPVWNLESYSRSPANIVAEMVHLNRAAGVDLFLFQDEFFVSGKRQVMEFCRELKGTGLRLEWKAFGRVNLVDEEMMRAMAECGCLELRFGVESGSDRVLKRIRKGFTAAQSLEVVPQAVKIFPRVDAFFVWGFPFETLEDFNQSLLQMVSFRMMGAEFVFTGHEVCRGGDIELPEKYRAYFDLVLASPDVFSGFFHIDLAGNVLPKLALLRQFGFYPVAEAPPPDPESCGAHSPRIEPQELATRTLRQ
jgi:radical SAM superfamily enzyme YgiQ (UPF0313 family)